MIEFAKDGPRHILDKFEKFEFFRLGGGGWVPLPSRSAHDFNINHDPMSG